MPSVPESQFDHVFLTRFAVRFTANQPPPDDAWLRYRFGFFAEATVASMRTQSVLPDRWLIFVDDESPRWLIGDLAELGRGVFDIVRLRQPWGHGPLRAAVEEVARRPFLITTRLDSDDAIGTRFVEVVQAQFAEQEALYVDLVRGLQVDRSGQVFRYDFPLNPFISFIERRNGSPRTVFQSFRHLHSRRYAPVRSVITTPMWIQVVHGSNLMNAIHGPRAHPKVASAAVDMDLPYRESVGTATLRGEQALSWARLLWLWLRHPGHLRIYLTARRLIAQGTQTLPISEQVGS